MREGDLILNRIADKIKTIVSLVAIQDNLK